MPELEARLLCCFASVFPGLTAEEIRDADADLSAWDSLTGVRLLAVLEQEFGLEISEDEMQRLTSFAAIHDYLIRQTAAVTGPLREG